MRSHSRAIDAHQKRSRRDGRVETVVTNAWFLKVGSKGCRRSGKFTNRRPTPSPRYAFWHVESFYAHIRYMQKPAADCVTRIPVIKTVLYEAHLSRI